MAPEFYKQLCSRLAIPLSGGKTEMFKNLQSYIYHLYRDKKKTLILIIDEAQYLKNSVLTDLKMLMNFVYDSLNCFVLILSGEPYLNNTLELSIHEALLQRVVTHYDYKGLSPAEINDYILHKINLGGGSPDIIGAEAVAALTGYCKGNPRLIDKVMCTALQFACALDYKVINGELMPKAILEQSLSGEMH